MERVVVKQRDRFSIEVKARYLIPESSPRRVSYRLRLYFFLPRSFAVTPDRYPADRFYRQLEPHLRFNTPEFTFEELLDPASARSPFAGIEAALAGGYDNGIDHERLLHEARLLAMIYKSLLRDFLLSLRTDASRDAPVHETLRSAHRVAERFHAIVQSVGGIDGPIDRDFVRRCAILDEHLSLLLETYLGSFLSRVDRTRCPEAAQTAVRIVRAENAYRTERGYPMVLSRDAGESDLEQYVYREKLLKKWASEVLFCEVRRRNTARTVQHILYALAAGVAMAVATGIAFFGQTRFGNLTTSLFALLVVGYMLKDRIKDIFRELFRRRLAHRFHDRRSTVRDPRRTRRIASIAERTSFVTIGSLPDRVAALRDRGWFEQTLAAFTEESILRYAKSARLDAGRLDQLHHRIRGLADINIIDLAPFFTHLSAQYGPVPVPVGEEEIALHSVKRLYHLNLVVEYGDASGTLARRFRLVVDAGGIQRIEPVPSGSAACDRAISFVGRGAATEDLETEETVE